VLLFVKIWCFLQLISTTREEKKVFHEDGKKIFQEGKGKEVEKRLQKKLYLFSTGKTLH